MIPIVRRALAAARAPVLLAVAAALALAAPAAGQGLSPQQRGEVEGVIRDYILKNPELLIQALQAAEERERARLAARQREAVVAEQAALTRSPGDPVGGNPRGDVTIVEFFDYRCPYCKQVKPAVREAVRADGKVRVVYKEFPILSRESAIAARAALAADRQGKYVAFHDALMDSKAPLNEDSIRETARRVGIDVDRMAKDMDDPRIDAVLRANRALADKLDIRGTPAFVVGGELLPGAVDAETLRAAIARARKG